MSAGTSSSEPADDAIAAHEAAVWRSRANFLFAARIKGAGDSGLTHEQLWARQAGEYRFQVCCIHFFLYDVALGDFVETDADYLLRRVISRGGRWVFRAWFERHEPETHERVHRDLHALGALTEWRTARFVAIDAEDAKAAQCVADYLQREEDRGVLVYETGKQAD